jgi:hypothetical protein
MHSSARRAGYPSDSSRAERQQTGTRPAGGGPLLYDYAVDRLRHLRHRSLPPCGRAVPLVALGPVPARAGTRRHRTWPPLRARARCPTVTVLGSPQRLGSGAPPATTHLRAGDPPPSPHPAAAASRGRCHSGRCPCGASWAADCAARCGLPGRHSGLQEAGSPDCIAIRWAGRRAPGRRRWGQRRGRDRPGETAEDAVHCEGPVYPPGPESRAATRDRRRTPLG